MCSPEKGLLNRSYDWQDEFTRTGLLCPHQLRPLSVERHSLFWQPILSGSASNSCLQRRWLLWMGPGVHSTPIFFSSCHAGKYEQRQKGNSFSDQHRQKKKMARILEYARIMSTNTHSGSTLGRATNLACLFVCYSWRL